MKRSRREIALNVALLILILALAAGVRFYQIGHQSLWSDEGNSAALATRSLVQITRDAAHDIHPPLYYWLLRLWTRAAGMSELGLRSLSAVLGVLLVWAVAELGRRLYDETAGLVTGIIAALAPFQVYYSQETRMYILLALEATLAALVFWWYVSQEDHWLPLNGAGPGHRLRLLPVSGRLLTLIWAAGLYTHYAFPVMIALLTGLYLVWLWMSRNRGSVRWRLLRWGLLLALTAGFYAPWLPIAIRQLTIWPTGHVPASARTAIQVSLAILGLGPVARDQIGVWWMWALPALALLGILPWRGNGKRTKWLSWLIPFAWACAPLVMMLVFGLFREAYLKFLLIASPAYALLLARGALAPLKEFQLPPASADEIVTDSSVEPVPRPVGLRVRDLLGVAWSVAALILIGSLSVTALARYYTDPTVARDDYRGIVQFIAATARSNDAILLDAPGQVEVFNYYYHGDLPVYPLPRQRPLDPEATRAELAKLLNYDKVYALYWATGEADPDQLIERWMNSRGYKTLDQWRGNVRLVVYVMPERRQPDEIVDDLNLSLGPDIGLKGYRSWNLTLTAGQVTQLQLLWQAAHKPTRRYKVFVQLLDSRDQVIAQRDSEPAGDNRPTDSWNAGEVILDNHGVLIPPGTPPGTYQRIVGMYDRETGARLRLPDGSDYITLQPITVKRSKQPPSLDAFDMQFTQSFDFGGITLLGHDRYKRGFRHAPNTPIQPGDRLHLTFYWQAKIQPRADWWFNLTLSDDAGRVVASLQAPLVGETYATTLWEKGEIVRGEHDLQIPSDLPCGTYRLSLVLLPDTDTPAGTAYLGTVKVTE